MSRFYYDLHTHSCLSPCADADNTPNNLAGMAYLNGIRLMALTDHNSCKNCPAFFSAAERYGIVPVAGAEITTSEDIHMICLFEQLEAALEFDNSLQTYRTFFPNRTDIYGQQLITDKDDNVIGTDEFFLPIATALDIAATVKKANSFGGICYPAHIDRPANGIMAVLGCFPENPSFSCAELNSPELRKDYSEKTGIPETRFLIGSDAHFLTALRENNDSLEIYAEPHNGAAVRKELFKWLRGEL